MASIIQSIFGRWRVVAGVAGSRLYLFGILYLLFLTTDFLGARSGFLFKGSQQDEESREYEIKHRFWERIAPYDGQFYLDIANNGYRRTSASKRGDFGNYAFFPLLPGTMAILRTAFPRAYVPLTIALSLAAGIVGTLALWKIAERFGVNALLAAALVLTFPSAAFQYVLYTESFFLCASGLAILSAIENRSLSAACFGCLAGLSRPQGILLTLPIFAELVLPALRGQRRQPRATAMDWFATAAPLAGFLVMGAVSVAVSGSPLSFLTVQTHWGRSYEVGGLIKAIVSAFGYFGPPMDVLGILIGVGCLPVIWKHLPLSLALYGTGMVFMPLATGTLLSFSRFISVSIPHMLALAIILEKRPELRSAVLVTFLILETLVAKGLMGWHLVG